MVQEELKKGGSYSEAGVGVVVFLCLRPFLFRCRFLCAARPADELGSTTRWPLWFSRRRPADRLLSITRRPLWFLRRRPTDWLLSTTRWPLWLFRRRSTLPLRLRCRCPRRFRCSKWVFEFAVEFESGFASWFWSRFLRRVSTLFRSVTYTENLWMVNSRSSVCGCASTADGT